MKDKDRKLTCFSEYPIVLRLRRILGVWIFYAPSHIAYFAFKIYNKFNRSVVLLWGGDASVVFFVVSRLKTLYQCRVK